MNNNKNTILKIYLLIITLLRPPTGGKRDESLSVVKEEVLTKKIKTLEIQLDEYKKKDEQNKLLRKLKVRF